MSELDIDVDSIDTDDSLGLGEEDKGKVNTNNMDWYKGEKGRTDRVAIIFFDKIDQTVLRRAIRQNPKLTSEEKRALLMKARQALAEKLGKPVDQLDDVDLLDMSEPRFKAFSASYKKDVGYVQWPAKLSPEEEKIWKKAGEKKDYVTTLLCKYPTERDGDVYKDRLAKETRIIPWRFSPDKYNQIRKINKGQQENGSSVAAVDLLISCQDTGFQKLDIHSAGSCIYQKNDKFKRQILETALPMYDKLNPFRQLTTEELREKLGMGGGSSGGGGADVTDDFSSVLGNL